MKEFPSFLVPSNSPNFNKILYERKLHYLRQSVFEHILTYQVETRKEKEECQKVNKDNIKSNKLIKERYACRRDGFDLKAVIKGVGGLNLGEVENSMIEIIKKELEDKGWKVSLGVGNTMLFINDPKDEIPAGIESTSLF